MVFRVDPVGGTTAGSVTAGQGVKAIVVVGPILWAANASDNTGSQIDVATMATVRTVRVGPSPTVLAADGRTIWVANDDNTVSRIDG
jgi:DNA-binding beta-propeller fold protein YncE